MHIQNSIPLKFILINFALIIFSSCSKEKPASQISESQLPPLFTKLYQSDSLDLIIETDVQSILNNKHSEENHYQSATVTAVNNGIEILSGQMEVRPRGKTRKARCNFPPLMLKLRDSKCEEFSLSPSGNIKIVSYCKDSLEYDQWLIKEFLCYKYFNLLSDYSFNVKFANITYKDALGNFPEVRKNGFIIEPFEELSARVSCAMLDDEQSVKRIDKERYKLLTMFQYLIGNTDWNLSRRHNIRLLECDKNVGPIPIPYDFDYSGFVNAGYARPHDLLPIESVTERLFQWRGAVDEDFTNILTEFLEKKSQFIDLHNNLEYLTSIQKEQMELYVDEFFELTSTPVKINQAIQAARKKS